MRKTIFAFALCLILVAFSGCSETKQEKGSLTEVGGGFNYIIYKHEETGVYYLKGGSASFTVMVNADGTPYTGE